VAALSAGRLNRPRAALTSKITNSGWSIKRVVKGGGKGGGKTSGLGGGKDESKK
jgi:hypothetical protein